MNPKNNPPKERERPMQKTYHNITSLIAYWVTDLEANTQDALRLIQTGHDSCAIESLLINRDRLKILHALHESIFTIYHRRG